MNTQLNQEDIKNILVLISRTTLKGEEAMGTAILQQKLGKMLEPVIDPKTAGGTETKDADTNKSSTEYSLDA